jgi:hypothetical protein
VEAATQSCSEPAAQQRAPSAEAQAAALVGQYQRWRATHGDAPPPGGVAAWQQQAGGSAQQQVKTQDDDDIYE